MDYQGFVGASYAVQSQSADAQRCINLYPQPDETGEGKSQGYLFSTPGLKRVVDVSGLVSGGIRGEYEASNDRLFFVAGNHLGSSLFEVDQNFAVIGRYPLPNEIGEGPVSMTDNGRSMFIATGPNAYWFTFADTGALETLSIGSRGTGWAVDDTFTIGAGNGLGTVTAVSGGAVTGVSITTAGTGYANASNVATAAQLPSVGVGLTVDLTVLAGDTLSQVTDEVFQGAGSCGFLDGYIVFNQPGTQIFWITYIYSTTIDPLGFASAEGSPDNLLSLLVDHRELWLFGDTSTEVWYDSGNANFPFSFIQGAFITHGTVAPASPARLDNTTFWLGNDEFGSGIVWRANGYAPGRVSNFAVEQAIQRYPTIKDAVSWTYQQDGHSFYVLNFPSGDATWVYDAATGQWHERAYLGTLLANDGTSHRGRPNTHAFAFGRHVVGDWEKGYLYQMDVNVFEDDGREIRRIRRAPYINTENKRIFFSKFELAMEVGKGNPLAVDPDPANPVDPQISLRWSDDGGNTWSNYKTVSMGLSGQYRTRVIWRRLGWARERIFEVSTGQNNVNLAIFAAYLELLGVDS